jgi:GNAT superfamily N-acetyltransferase
VTGVATGHVFHSIHSTPIVAWLTTLVVHERHQHSGIGRQLAAAVEDWARERGASRISVTSGKHRDGAHVFYEKIGYERTGVRLTKALT